jgi:hypothetical protein
MKFFLVTLILFSTVSKNCSGQKNAEQFKAKQLKDTYFSDFNYRDQIVKYNFSKLFSQTDNPMIFGFIGNHFQRIRIKFISVIKDTSCSNTYNVHGKCMVKNNVNDFYGTIIITNIRKQKQMSFGVDNEYKNKGIKGQYIIIGDYMFSENRNQKYSGIFKGAFVSNFYIDKNDKIVYDNIDLNSDSYTNNEFVGEWINSSTNITKTCNWGDYRIPESGDLDAGAGEFSPAKKYLAYGWESRNYYFVQSGSKYKSAKKVEEANWWK